MDQHFGINDAGTSAAKPLGLNSTGQINLRDNYVFIAIYSLPYLFSTLITLFYCLICRKEEQETKITIEEFLLLLPLHQYQIKYIL